MTVILTRQDSSILCYYFTDIVLNCFCVLPYCIWQYCIIIISFDILTAIFQVDLG